MNRRLGRSPLVAYDSSMDQRKPGDLFLDRYLPNADEEMRERARDALREFALFLIRVGERVERQRQGDHDSEESLRRPTI